MDRLEMGKHMDDAPRIHSSAALVASRLKSYLVHIGGIEVSRSSPRVLVNVQSNRLGI